MALVQYAQGLGFNLQYCKKITDGIEWGFGDSLWRYGLTCSQKDFVPAFVRQPKDTWRVPYRSRNIRVNSGARDMIQLYLNACLVCFLKP